MLKILIVGLGSIGRKHVEALRAIGGTEIAALRTTKGTLSHGVGIKEFFSLKEALAFSPDGVIISNPTALHASSALPFLENGVRVLIEKPIASDIHRADVLLPYESLFRVAYCMRFHPINFAIKKILLSEKPFKVGFRRSFYLPKWHRYADYRKEYVARKQDGGGVIRTLSHEIDLMIHWFGQPKNVVGVTDKISPLEIDTDDYAFFTCRFHDQLRVNFDLDLFSPVNINTGELFTTAGKYQWDMTRISFVPFENDELAWEEYFDADSIKKMYSDQIKDFMTFIASGSSSNATAEQSLDVLRVIEKIDE
jgi:predicted dehydrogenase